jgi:predicted negative regulator of RcsB-dependent stress response
VEDLTDNEREEQLRRWWSDNWAWIIGGVALGLALLAGWQYWQRHQVQVAERDLASYQAVLEGLDSNQRDVAGQKADALRKEHPASPYADQADLALARVAAERGELDEAARRLGLVADNSKDPELRIVARTRLARVLVAQGKPDEALALLDPAQAGAFAAYVREIRGDAYKAKGDADAARREYDAALVTPDAEKTGLDARYVELKRDALGIAAAPAAAAAAPVPAPAAAAAPAEAAPR